MNRAADRRLYRRVPISYEVKLVLPDQIIVFAKAVDLSMGGILVNGPERLPVGTECGVAILLGEGEPGRRVVTRGVVVRSDGWDTGLSFSKALDAQSEKALRLLIASNFPGAEIPLEPAPAETGTRSEHART